MMETERFPKPCRITERHHDCVTAAFDATELMYGISPDTIANTSIKDADTQKARAAMVYALRKTTEMSWDILTRLMIGKLDTSGLRMAYRRATEFFHKEDCDGRNAVCAALHGKVLEIDRKRRMQHA